MTSKAIKRGVRDLTFWWLEGEPPVNGAIAQARANICLGCPMNEREAGLDKLTVAVARRVRTALASKHEMKLELIDEDKLGLCEACGCSLKLKPWTPKSVIWKHGTPDYFEELDGGCWIRSEDPLKP